MVVGVGGIGVGIGCASAAAVVAFVAVAAFGGRCFATVNATAVTRLGILQFWK